MRLASPMFMQDYLHWVRLVVFLFESDSLLFVHRSSDGSFTPNLVLAHPFAAKLNLAEISLSRDCLGGRYFH